MYFVCSKIEYVCLGFLQSCFWSPIGLLIYYVKVTMMLSLSEEGL